MNFIVNIKEAWKVYKKGALPLFFVPLIYSLVISFILYCARENGSDIVISFIAYFSPFGTATIYIMSCIVTRKIIYNNGYTVGASIGQAFAVYKKSNLVTFLVMGALITNIISPEFALIITMSVPPVLEGASQKEKGYMNLYKTNFKPLLCMIIFVIVFDQLLYSAIITLASILTSGTVTLKQVIGIHIIDSEKLLIVMLFISPIIAAVSNFKSVLSEVTFLRMSK